MNNFRKSYYDTKYGSNFSTSMCPTAVPSTHTELCMYQSFTFTHLNNSHTFMRPHFKVPTDASGIELHNALMVPRSNHPHYVRRIW